MSRKLTLCLAQINVQPGHVREHLERIKEIILEYRKCDLIVFPELILQGHPSVDKPEGLLYRKAKIVYGYVSSELYRFIREVSARVILGEMRRRVDNLYNVATYIDPKGTQHYTKTHVHWTEHFVPGNSLRTFDTPFGSVGINICFDAAFSEVWRVLGLAGCELLVNISAVPADFPVSYMHRRMIGAALNNQAFVAYVNRAAPQFAGHSAIFDPRGERVTAAGPGETVLTAEIDLEEVQHWRQEEPVLEHRRPQLYREITGRASWPREVPGEIQADPNLSGTGG